MSQHYTLNTISASHWCSKCGKFTAHRIDKGRKGPCLDCIARYDNAPKVVKLYEEEKQEELFK